MVVVLAAVLILACLDMGSVAGAAFGALALEKGSDVPCGVPAGGGAA